MCAPLLGTLTHRSRSACATTLTHRSRNACATTLTHRSRSVCTIAFTCILYFSSPLMRTSIGSTCGLSVRPSAFVWFTHRRFTHTRFVALTATSTWPSVVVRQCTACPSRQRQVALPPRSAPHCSLWHLSSRWCPRCHSVPAPHPPMVSLEDALLTMEEAHQCRGQVVGAPHPQRHGSRFMRRRKMPRSLTCRGSSARRRENSRHMAVHSQPRVRGRGARRGRGRSVAPPQIVRIGATSRATVS